MSFYYSIFKEVLPFLLDRKELNINLHYYKKLLKPFYVFYKGILKGYYFKNSINFLPKLKRKLFNNSEKKKELLQQKEQAMGIVLEGLKKKFEHLENEKLRICKFFRAIHKKLKKKTVVIAKIFYVVRILRKKVFLRRFLCKTPNLRTLKKKNHFLDVVRKKLRLKKNWLNQLMLLRKNNFDLFFQLIKHSFSKKRHYYEKKIRQQLLLIIGNLSRDERNFVKKMRLRVRDSVEKIEIVYNYLFEFRAIARYFWPTIRRRVKKKKKATFFLKQRSLSSSYKYYKFLFLVKIKKLFLKHVRKLVKETKANAQFNFDKLCIFFVLCMKNKFYVDQLKKRQKMLFFNFFYMRSIKFPEKLGIEKKNKLYRKKHVQLYKGKAIALTLLYNYLSSIVNYLKDVVAFEKLLYSRFRGIFKRQSKKYFFKLYRLYFIRFKNIFYKRSIKVSEMLQLVLSRFFEPLQIRVLLHSLGTKTVGANVMASYLIAKFHMRYRINRLMIIFFQNFFKNMGIKGLFLILSGRFTRAERATFKKVKRGRIKKTTFSYHTDFSFRQVILKYGICGLKIFVTRKRPFLKSFW